MLHYNFATYKTCASASNSRINNIKYYGYLSIITKLRMYTALYTELSACLTTIILVIS